MMTQTKYLMWFRQDLRLFDNTAFYACCKAAHHDGSGVLAIAYITPKQWQQHHKSLWQIDLILRQLTELKSDLSKLNIGLIVRISHDFKSQQQDLLRICRDNNICHLFANKEYLINELHRDDAIRNHGQNITLQTHWYDDGAIIPPKTIKTDKQQPYKVFTPFYKRWLKHLQSNPINPHNAILSSLVTTIDMANTLSSDGADGLSISEYYQRYHRSEAVFNQQLTQVVLLGEKLYPAGETAAQQRLHDFLATDVLNYDVARDIPSLNSNQGATSRLSPYLATGIISARTCHLKALQTHANDATQAHHRAIDCFISELCWRDFYLDVISHRPDIVKGVAFLSTLDQAVKWRYDDTDFLAWCQGKTGVPLVDAAMRSLNATGFLHNRLRMVVAMYLTKNLLIDWRWGERYFMQHLADGDFASNNGGWQWSASIGTDAQPYFRVMNPFSQAATHDSEASFIKCWVDELKFVPTAIINDEVKLQKYLAQNPSIKYPKLSMPTKNMRASAIEMFKHAKQQ